MLYEIKLRMKYTHATWVLVLLLYFCSNTCAYVYTVSTHMKCTQVNCFNILESNLHHANCRTKIVQLF